MRTTRYLVPTLILTVLLSGCGGDDGASGAAGADGLSTLMAVRAEAPGANCAIGGSRIEAGLDADGNGSLGASEVSSTQYMCSGGAGSSAVNTLVQMLDEPSGPNCAAGGKAIKLGSDSNANGVLDAQELSSTQYVCNGANGTNGADGADGANGTNGTNGAVGSNGLSTLLSIVSEPAGGKCAYGGSRVNTGLDANGDGALGAGEVSATSYYICNAAALSWVEVTDAAVEARSNTGYIATNDAARVVVTLPADPPVGAVVRVKGEGSGGWTIAQRDGQAVRLGVMAGVTWTARAVQPPDATVRPWYAVASSSDGARLVAVENPGQIHTSADSGMTWTAHSTDAKLARNWEAVASSSGGTRLVAAESDGQIYTSTDSGATWTAHSTNLSVPTQTRNWVSVASSSDGSTLVAAAASGLAGAGDIYIWTEASQQWTAIGPPTPTEWISVACAQDCRKLVAAAQGDQIYTSTDGGPWILSGAPPALWWSVASSTDGSKLVAVGIQTHIYTSDDGGQNWTPRDSVRDWLAVASSSDGTKLVAATCCGQIYTSSDSGVNWTPRESNRSWYSVASSADGSRLVAVDNDGQIYTSAAMTTVGANGSISGTYGDAVELIYLGNGLFDVLSHEGSLTVQ